MQVTNEARPESETKLAIKSLKYVAIKTENIEWKESNIIVFRLSKTYLGKVEKKRVKQQYFSNEQICYFKQKVIHHITFCGKFLLCRCGMNCDKNIGN